MQQKEATIQIPPGFTKPLSKIVPKRINIDDTYKQDHESNVGSVNQLSGKQCSLRENNSPKSLYSGRFPPPSTSAPGRPPMKRSDGELATYFCFYEFLFKFIISIFLNWVLFVWCSIGMSVVVVNEFSYRFAICKALI